MQKIRINSIQCVTPDEIDKDEIFLKKNGRKIWPKDQKYHKIDSSDIVNINLILAVSEGWNEIEVWDYDFLSLNDKLGIFKFKADSISGKYSTSMLLHDKKSMANYIMYWEIIEKK